MCVMFSLLYFLYSLHMYILSLCVCHVVIRTLHVKSAAVLDGGLGPLTLGVKPKARL